MGDGEKTYDDDEVAEHTHTTTITESLIERVNQSGPKQESCLVLLTGPEIGKRIPFVDDKLAVGRDGTCQVSLRESSVSRNHAEIIIKNDDAMVHDLGSTNGTYVNDSLITKATLRDGDIVKFGRVIFKYLSGTNIENAYHQEIYRLTTTDPMTQIYNRRFFMDGLDREVSRSRRYKHAMALLMIDLDHFKNINDTYGHLAGDHVLKMVGRSLERSLRREDILCRYGGEEFAALLPETGREIAIEVAERLREAVSKRAYTFDGFPIPVTVSIGVAGLNPTDDKTGLTLLKRADNRLLSAKKQGRNQSISIDKSSA
jgi:two-component system cell cycle response regulator